jgi:hypothetical protein
MTSPKCTGAPVVPESLGAVFASSRTLDLLCPHCRPGSGRYSPSVYRHDTGAHFRLCSNCVLALNSAMTCPIVCPEEGTPCGAPLYVCLHGHTPRCGVCAACSKKGLSAHAATPACPYCLLENHYDVKSRLALYLASMHDSYKAWLQAVQIYTGEERKIFTTFDSTLLGVIKFYSTNIQSLLKFAAVQYDRKKVGTSEYSAAVNKYWAAMSEIEKEVSTLSPVAHSATSGDPLFSAKAVLGHGRDEDRRERDDDRRAWRAERRKRVSDTSLAPADASPRGSPSAT